MEVLALAHIAVLHVLLGAGLLDALRTHATHASQAVQALAVALEYSPAPLAASPDAQAMFEGMLRCLPQVRPEGERGRAEGPLKPVAAPSFQAAAHVDAGRRSLLSGRYAMRKYRMLARGRRHTWRPCC